MIKGINHQIIELCDTSNLYYEKAWLMVKPEYANLQQHLLEKEARKLLKEIDAPSTMKARRTLPYRISRLLLSTGVGVALTLIFQSIF